MSLATLAIEEAPGGPRRIVFEVSVKAAERIALALDEEEETAPLTVALFDLGGARVESSIYLPANLPPDFVLDLIGRAANGEELASLRVETARRAGLGHAVATAAREGARRTIHHSWQP